MKTVRPMIRQFRQIFAVLLRSKEGETNPNEITEHELIEAMLITEAVVISRLKGDPLEWKGDNKRRFNTLFNSIKIESIESIRIHFTTDGEPQRGASLNKFNTILLDSLFEILQLAGPRSAPRIVTLVRRAVEWDLKTLPETHADDGLVARALLAKYSKDRVQRLRKPKKLTRSQRLTTIAITAQSLQAA